MSSSPIDREARLNSLRLKLGRELEEDFRKAGPNLMHWLVRELELATWDLRPLTAESDFLVAVLGW